MSKFRKDFVTNSSSSSFVCEVCGYNESGWDLCLGETCMCECEEGHIFCIDESPLEEELNVYLEEDRYNRSYDVPKKFCPICTHAHITDREKIDHMLKLLDKTVREIEDEIRESYK